MIHEFVRNSSTSRIYYNLLYSVVRCWNLLKKNSCQFLSSAVTPWGRVKCWGANSQGQALSAKPRPSIGSYAWEMGEALVTWTQQLWQSFCWEGVKDFEFGRCRNPTKSYGIAGLNWFGYIVYGCLQKHLSWSFPNLSLATSSELNCAR